MGEVVIAANRSSSVSSCPEKCLLFLLVIRPRYFLMMFYVYVIKSDNGKQYTGQTSDIERRLDEYNSGLCKSTKIDTKWRVVHLEQYLTRSEAIKREKWLKSGRGREFIKEMTRGRVRQWSDSNHLPATNYMHILYIH